MISIYALVDPRDDTVCYVGLSKNPAKRYTQHLSGHQRNKAKMQWIQELLASQLLPKLVVLEDVAPEQNAFEREAYWTMYYARNGHPVTNMEWTRVGCFTSRSLPTREHVLEDWRKRQAMKPEQI